MELDLEKFKTFVTYILTNFKDLESELSAFQMALIAFKRTYHDPSAGAFFEVTLQVARQSKPLQQAMHDKYDIALEKFLRQASQRTLDPEVVKWFQEWKPTGAIN